MLTKNLIKGLISGTILLCCTTVFAQDQSQQAPPPQQQMQQPGMQQPPMHRRPPEERASKQLEWMQKNLGLTPDQHDRAFNVLVRAAREEDRANMNMQPGQQEHQEKKEIKKDEYGELRQILNPDQFQQFMGHVKEMKEKAREQKQGMPQQQQGQY